MLKVRRVVALGFPSFLKMLVCIRTLPLVPQILSKIIVQLSPLLGIGYQVALEQLVADGDAALKIPIPIASLIIAIPTQFAGG